VLGALKALAATWPALRGLEARLCLSGRGLAELLAAPWLPKLDEVLLSMSRLPVGGAAELFAALGQPSTVELQHAQLGAVVPWHVLAPHLSRCRWMRLGGNAITSTTSPICSQAAVA
jgi:hypothetical protein